MANYEDHIIVQLFDNLHTPTECSGQDDEEDGVRMALIYRTKTTHSYSATAQHFQQFFSTLTQMYDDQAHTDVHLISSEGTVFGVHRVRSMADCFYVQRPTLESIQDLNFMLGIRVQMHI